MTKDMIEVRSPEKIHTTRGEIKNGTFTGRWHFSFGEYEDERNRGFGNLKVFNDDTLSPGAVWPLHPHRDIEVVTYCADGEFRHADKYGKGWTLKKGWVQHTTVGRGMWHSEINNSTQKPMRFIQMWFSPLRPSLMPSVECKAVERLDRTDRLLPIVSTHHEGALDIASDARVFSSFLREGFALTHPLSGNRGSYLYVVEGGPVEANGKKVVSLGAAKVYEEEELTVKALGDAELVLVDVALPGS